MITQGGGGLRYGRSSAHRLRLQISTTSVDATVLNDGDEVGPTKQEASRILRIAHPGIVALVRDGRLAMETVRQRRTGQPYEVVTPGSLAAFRREYVSVSLVGQEWGVHPHAARARLRQDGVMPAFPVPAYGTPIFRTRDIHPGPAPVRAI